MTPQSAENQLALAVTLYRQGNTEKAIKLAQSALKIDPEFSQFETLQKNLWVIKSSLMLKNCSRNCS
ncbi:MAG UNVERIFIED_CONTAM: tetratricopeptide repeat protein [Microcystis novacekii LVE1205-3]